MSANAISGCMLQPVVDLESGDVLYREMLVRFIDGRHVQQTILAAEANGTVHEIDLAVLRTALAALRSDMRLIIAVNISAQTAEAHAAEVLSAISEHGEHANRLVIEITETAPIFDTSAISWFVARVRCAGARVAVDDFGHGFSDAARTEIIRPDFVKLPKGGAYGWTALTPIHLEGIRRLAHESGAAIIAEGVETASEVEVIRGLGIDAGQGYLFGKPSAVGTSVKEEPDVQWRMPKLVALG